MVGIHHRLPDHSEPVDKTSCFRQSNHCAHRLSSSWGILTPCMSAGKVVQLTANNAEDCWSAPRTISRSWYQPNEPEKQCYWIQSSPVQMSSLERVRLEAALAASLRCSVHALIKSLTLRNMGLKKIRVRTNPNPDLQNNGLPAVKRINTVKETALGDRGPHQCWQLFEDTPSMNVRNQVRQAAFVRPLTKFHTKNQIRERQI